MKRGAPKKRTTRCVWVVTDDATHKQVKALVKAIRNHDALILGGPTRMPDAYNTSQKHLDGIRNHADVVVCCLLGGSHEKVHWIGGFASALNIPVIMYGTPCHHSMGLVGGPVLSAQQVIEKATKVSIKDRYPLMLPRVEGWYEEQADEVLGGWWQVVHHIDEPPSAGYSPPGTPKRAKISHK